MTSTFMMSFSVVKRPASALVRQVARNIVEPDALAEVVQLLCRVHMSCSVVTCQFRPSQLMKIIRPRHNPERVRLTSRGLSCGLTLTNGCRLVADIDERELRGIKETYATKYETPTPTSPSATPSPAKR